ncbi:hypothetical protein NL676_010156 [Syzygium grande]|nr:hypothetical protein NL676_010156 [Syzygium grande]
MAELTVTGLLKKAALAFPKRTAVSTCGKFDLTHERLQQLVNHAAMLPTPVASASASATSSRSLSPTPSSYSLQSRSGSA